jgi:two-component system, NtrC family, sensor kinase
LPPSRDTITKNHGGEIKIDSKGNGRNLYYICLLNDFLNMQLKKNIAALLFFIGLPFAVFAQLNYADSIKNEIRTCQNDTLKMVLYSILGSVYQRESYDSSLSYSQKHYQLAKMLNYKLDEAYALDNVGYNMYYLSNPTSLQILLEGVKIAEDPEIEKKVLPEKYWNQAVYYDTNALPKNLKKPLNVRLQTLASLYQDVGHVYGNDYGNRQRQLYYYFKAVGVAETVNDKYSVILNYNTIANVYLITKKLDSSLLYAQKAHDLAVSARLPQLSIHTFQILASTYFAMKNYPLAVHFAERSIQDGSKYNNVNGVVLAKLVLSDFFSLQKNIDSSIYYAKSAYETAKLTNSPQFLLSSTEALAKLYESTNSLDSSIKYLQLAYALKDNVYNSEKIKQIQRLDYEEQQKQKELEASRQKYQGQLRVYLLLAGLVALLAIAGILLRNIKNKQKAFTLLQKQKNETESQRAKAEQTLRELRATQTQLIQSEKMASLGELTAGIAHEIQNPLNFVNNFSEVNRELIDELRGERLKPEGERNNYFEDQLLNDIRQNLEKINHHGKRADSIVKGMLQHSKTSLGQRELTDINALADEYLRLSYHGMRAKDKSYNAELHTDFDKEVGKIMVIPQDIGRVLLNLYNNAFYSMSDKAKLNKGYEPKISVATKKIDGKVFISVTDNGKGIPETIKDKIFQPFFTTKPPGQGTGLGLSLSYDIITKEHGGQIKVESKDEEGAEFMISLPI